MIRPGRTDAAFGGLSGVETSVNMKWTPKYTTRSVFMKLRVTMKQSTKLKAKMTKSHIELLNCAVNPSTVHIP